MKTKRTETEKRNRSSDYTNLSQKEREEVTRIAAREAWRAVRSMQAEKEREEQAKRQREENRMFEEGQKRNLESRFRKEEPDKRFWVDVRFEVSERIVDIISGFWIRGENEDKTKA